MNHNPDYTFGIASLEIIVLLAVAFLLGMLLCGLLRKMNSGGSNGSTSSFDRSRESRSVTSSGGYTADVNSLLRSSGDNVASGVTRAAASVANAASNAGTGITGVAGSLISGFASVAHLGDGRKDDLKKLEGIGPKLEQILNTAGIMNFDQLAALTPDAIKPVLEAAGGQFKLHDPKSWPYQAELATKGEWERLKEYQNLLISGRAD